MKELIKITFCLISFCIIFSGCGNKQTTQTNIDTVSKKTNLNQPNESTVNTSLTMTLLQGSWQSLDDESNYVIFENNHRKELAIESNGTDEEFVLSEKCMNKSDANNGIPSEKDKYISCLQSDMCWYIVKLDSVNLELSYMGRGNTLRYMKTVLCDN